MLVSFLLVSGCISGNQPSDPNTGHFSRIREPVVDTDFLNTEIPGLQTTGATSKSSHEPLRQVAATALDRARTSMLSEKKVAVDVLWVLAQIQYKQHDAAIAGFIQDMKGHVPNPSYLPGVFPNSPKVDLPDSLPQGTRRFLTNLQAPCGEPQKKALRYLKQFISEENTSGYILTHQLIVLLLAEQAEFSISPEMKDIKRHLLEKIYREQTQMTAVDCVDLYMERVALLLFFGNKQDLDRQATDSWIHTIAEMQLPDGSWPRSKGELSYDGEKTSISSPRPHTTALAMLALQAYLIDD
jgi:hypothetical protein